MSESENPEEKSVILEIGDEGENTDIFPLITCAELDDETLLQCVRDNAESKDKVTLHEAIMALIASKILQLGIPDGRKILFPTSSIILRNLYRTGLFGKDVTLAALCEEIRKSMLLKEKMEHGMALGDRALHFRAGWRNNRMIGRVLSEKEVNRYSSSMAHFGYDTAINAAHESSTEKARIIGHTVPQIQTHFGKIVKVIASLTEEEKEEIEKRADERPIYIN